MKREEIKKEIRDIEEDYEMQRVSVSLPVPLLEYVDELVNELYFVDNRSDYLRIKALDNLDAWLALEKKNLVSVLEKKIDERIKIIYNDHLEEMIEQELSEIDEKVEALEEFLDSAREEND